MARHQVRQAVFVVIKNDSGEILFHRRQNTGFMDGRYDLPSGHVDMGETALAAAIKETLEETGLVVTAKDLDLFHISHFEEDKSYINFFFKAKKWSGTPSIKEPEKCDDMTFRPNDFYLQTEMTPQTALALIHLDDGDLKFSYVDKKRFIELGAPA